MRESVRDLDRLLHIRESMDNIREFVGEKTFDEFYGTIGATEMACSLKKPCTGGGDVQTETEPDYDI